MALGDGTEFEVNPALVENVDLIMTSKEDIAYAAGILDGEGYIGIKCSERPGVQRSRSHRVYVAVANKDEKMVAFLRNHFGGTYYYKERKEPNHAPIFTWKLSAKSAVDFLKLVHPYLITKRRQATIAIGFQTTVSTDNNAKGLTEDTLKLRDACMAKMHELNKRGPKEEV